MNELLRRSVDSLAGAEEVESMLDEFTRNAREHGGLSAPGNADIHLKNFSLLRSVEGDIRVSPANSIKRFEKGLDAAVGLIDRGFCSTGMATHYRKLVTDRWSRMGE